MEDYRNKLEAFHPGGDAEDGGTESDGSRLRHSIQPNLTGKGARGIAGARRKLGSGLSGLWRVSWSRHRLAMGAAIIRMTAPAVVSISETIAGVNSGRRAGERTDHEGTDRYLPTVLYPRQVKNSMHCLKLQKDEETNRVSINFDFSMR